MKIEAKKGKLGVLLPGLGAVSTTFVAGVLNVRKGIGQPVGSVTQMGTIRLGKRTDDRMPLIRDFLPLAEMDELEFGAWDLHGENAYQVVRRSEVLKPQHYEQIKDELEAIEPMKAVFDKEWVRRLDGTHVKSGKTKYDLCEQLREDIRSFKARSGVERLVSIWCGSTEVHTEISDVHLDPQRFEVGLKENHPAISPSMMYAYAHIMEDVPYANGAPNLALDVPALRMLAEQRKVAIAGKDFKTGQTLMKTILAPGFKARAIGMNGWYSTNILGNRDGEVLDDPGSFKSKEVSKLSVLETILEAQRYPELYGNIHHKVRIDYYPPRGDNKEGWDNIDIFGWLGYPMQIKVNFLCRDSILAAPVVLDLALLMDLSARAGMSGIQEWLSFYFKSPQAKPGLYPEHDLFIQKTKLKNTMRYMMGEDLITHLGLDYYQDQFK
ncbi:MAG: inositol-3-phosphate synthase [Myxococcota bacterium]|jgi:myo-inositol-1-phosphate synthase|nr:inositol-3-phosphate synthase [Myxococcota bacterium]